MNNSKLILDTCGCCEGVEKKTPTQLYNDHGLETLLYRVGTHGTFKESMITGLSESALLKELTIRENDDSTIALMDVWAMILDVLTFYNERIINEGYILTSTERLSLVELAKHISYIPKPGVAAGTWFSFLTDESPGAPLEATVTLGTRVQSIPGQDEKAQIFEAIEEILTQTKWNSIKPKLTEPQVFNRGLNKLYIEGTDTQLQVGDRILIVGSHRLENPGSERWDFRVVDQVVANSEDNYTEINWREGLGHLNPNMYPADDARIFVFRQQAALFGYNAPDIRNMSAEVKETFTGVIDYSGSEWPNLDTVTTNKSIHLDRLYPDILTDSWVLLTQSSDVELYLAERVQPSFKKAFSLASKTSKITLDGNENLGNFKIRNTVVWAQSEELSLIEAPIYLPVFGSEIYLEQDFQDLVEEQNLIISGELVTHLQVSSRYSIIKSGSSENIEYEELLFTPDDNLVSPYALNEEDILEVLSAPEYINVNEIRWFVKHGEIEGQIICGVDDLIPFIEDEDTSSVTIPTSLNQPIIVSELVEINESDVSRITLTQALKNVYHRATVTINANVAQATHGETKTEILGSGNGSVPFQKFLLKQKPLTYISSASASGIETTLEIRVDDIKWTEAPTFYKTSSEERIYITRTEDDGTTYVQFGNGITGSRLPTGVENIIATYRVGIGLEGLLDENQLSLLLTPQLGVKSVTNPVETSGAEDPESIENIRYNAPLTVLTLDRIVSVLDYENFTSAFAGIGKARADLLWKGEDRTVHLTVASADGKAIDSTLKENLINAIDGARHNNYPVVIGSFSEKLFNVKSKIKIHTDYVEEKVVTEVEEALIANYNFESRSFGQVVTPSEVIAIIQSVEGVVAVDLDELGGLSPFAEEHFRLLSNIAVWDGDEIEPAELLLIDEKDIDITLMT